jgi:hypothetical protein
MELQKIKNTISFLKDLQGIYIKEYSRLKEESKSLNLTNESSSLVTNWIDGMQVILVLLRFIRYGDSLDCSAYIPQNCLISRTQLGNFGDVTARIIERGKLTGNEAFNSLSCYQLEMWGKALSCKQKKGAKKLPNDLLNAKDSLPLDFENICRSVDDDLKELNGFLSSFTYKNTGSKLSFDKVESQNLYSPGARINFVLINNQNKKMKMQPSKNFKNSPILKSIASSYSMAFTKATSKKSIKESDDEEESDGDKENRDNKNIKRRAYNKVNSLTDDNERMILSKENKVASPTKKNPLTPKLLSTSQITENVGPNGESVGSNGESVGSNIECIANDTATNLKDTSSEEVDPSMPVETRKKRKRDEAKQDEESESTSNVVPTGEKENADNEEDRSLLDTISTSNPVIPMNYEHTSHEEKAGIDVLANLYQRDETISLTASNEFQRQLVQRKPYLLPEYDNAGALHEMHELNPTQAIQILTQYHEEQISFADVMQLEPDEIIRRSEEMLNSAFQTTTVGEQIVRNAEDDINNAYIWYSYAALKKSMMAKGKVGFDDLNAILKDISMT